MSVLRPEVYIFQDGSIHGIWTGQTRRSLKIVTHLALGHHHTLAHDLGELDVTKKRAEGPCHGA